MKLSPSATVLKLFFSITEAWVWQAKVVLPCKFYGLGQGVSYSFHISVQQIWVQTYCLYGKQEGKFFFPCQMYEPKVHYKL